MSSRNTHNCSLLLIFFGSLLVFTAGCNGSTHESPRTTQAAIIEIRLPEQHGSPQRPAIEFKHDMHVKELEQEGCQACHRVDPDGKQSPRLNISIGLDDWEDFMNSYHGICSGCHEKRRAEKMATGPDPEACGDCHVRQPQAVSMRIEMKFNYSLHYRHILAEKEKCENCHHIYNEKLKQLENKRDTESACKDCHKEKDQGNILSWRNAAHTDCISCHLAKTAKKQKTGPTACIGCHDLQSRKKIKKLPEIPRLKRNQPDKIWVQTSGTKSNLVAFDHEAHERLTSSCSSCHHDTLKPCGECHTLTGSEKGAGVTLEQAHHSPTSEYSCVGCHLKVTTKSECSDCHHAMRKPPGKQACLTCHNGPPPESAPEKPPEQLFTPVQLGGLPEPSKDVFPEKLVIKIEGRENYQPTQFPHLKITKKLYEQAVMSKLANRFHGRVETLCAGCHHYSPLGIKQPPCKSCHGVMPDPLKDKPASLAAYHVQCIFCHQQIGHKAQGCTDCHKKAL
ncbi:MAG: hypothetical protein JRJ87_20475 [Deltaproteobacteria bacterium]|nr:hypothetical protein [Deltaproteobacteria bacterium]